MGSFILIAIALVLSFYAGWIRGTIVADRKWRNQCDHVPELVVTKSNSCYYKCTKCNYYPLIAKFKEFKNV